MKKLLGILVFGLLWCNVAFADLNGKKLYCYKDSGGGIENHAALVFIENKQVKFSYMITFESKVSRSRVILQKTYNYEAGEDDIKIDTSLNHQTRFSKAFLNRQTLVLQFVGIMDDLICEIVDYDPLEKFEKIYREAAIKEEKKENKI